MDIFLKDKEAFGPTDYDDVQMVDARFGDPTFLHPYWQHREFAFMKTNTEMGYLNSYGDENLKSKILMLHHRVKNADITEKHVILGVGAGQLVAAAIHAYSLSGPKKVYAKPPYFSRFEQFTQFAGTGCKFYKEPPKDPHIEIVTSPNNPDGLHNTSNNEDAKKIYDLCYNWRQYGNEVQYNEDIMIFSLAKATGHASTRVGWALIKDKDIAEKMQHYVEMSTCGVGMESLRFTEAIINNQSCQPAFKDTVFSYGRAVLNERWSAFMLRATRHNNIKILNSNGMFAWGVANQDAQEMFEQMGILIVPGTYFGKDRSHFRINMGLPDEDFRRLLVRLSAL